MTLTTQDKRIKELIKELNYASDLYYNQSESPMSDQLFDEKFRELELLEKQTGLLYPESPTHKVGYVAITNKARHIRPILSLKNTKSIDDLLYFLKDKDGIMSWKLDGVSIVLYYNNGELINALTRGDGTTGTIIFRNALRIPNIPAKISFKGNLVVRGEGCISFKDFDIINNTKKGELFSNPRNLASGIVNTFTSPSSLLRHVSFIAHSIVSYERLIFATRSEQFEYLTKLGFNVVPYSIVSNFQLMHRIESASDILTRNEYPYPTDGLVLSYDDISFGESLGSTMRFPRHSIAYKWNDISESTKVVGMKWSVSNTGLITPVVLVEPTLIDGTTIRQVNLHNLKIFEDLEIGVGDILRVYKANKIIPKVEENLTRSGTELYPKKCPVCDSNTYIVRTKVSKKLYCDTCKH